MSFNETEWPNGDGISLIDAGWEPVNESIEWVRKPTEERHGLPICRFRKKFGEQVVDLEFRHDRKYTVFAGEWECDFSSLSELKEAVQDVLGE